MIDTLTLNKTPSVPSPEFVHDGVILTLWKQGQDTFSIARHLHVREFEVANRLARLRDANHS